MKEFEASPFEPVRAGLCLLGADSRVLVVNNVWLESTGLDGPVAGLDILSLSPVPHGLAPAMLLRAEQGETVSIPRYCLAAGGRERWWVGTMSPVSAVDGVGAAIMIAVYEVSARDITEQKRIESELQMRGRQQETVAELGRMALMGTDVATLMDVAAQRLAETLQVEYAKVLKLLPDGDTLLLLSGVGWREGLVGRAVVAGGAESQAGYTLRCQEPVIVADFRTESRFSGPPLLKDHGVVSGMSVIIRSCDRPFGVLGVHTAQRRSFSEDDVHFLRAVANILAAAIEHRQAEDALRESIDELRRRNAESQALLESSRSILRQPRFQDSARPIFESCKQLVGATAGYIAPLSAEGLVVDVLFMELGGYQCDVELSLPSPIHGLAQEAYLTQTTRFCNNLPDSQYAPLVPKGHIALDNALYAPMIIEGEVVGLLGLANKPQGFTKEDARLASAFADLAALALHNSRTRESLEHSQLHFSSVVETAGEAIICTDASGTIISWNRQAQILFGYSLEEAIGRSLTLLIPEAFQQEELDRLASVNLLGESGILATGLERLALTKGGGEVPVEISIAAWKTGDDPYFTFICRDIAARKRMEEQLLRAHRLEAAGRIAGQVAHDFNNLLGPLALYPDLIKMELPEGHTAAEYCDIMLESVRHMAEINSDMLALARRAHANREVIDLNRLIENAVAQMAARPDSLAMELDLAPDLLALSGSSGQLLRVVTNLLSNAREAVEDVGRISVKTENLYVDDAFGHHSRVPVGEYVRLSVSDDGPGIAPEIRGRLFDSFFSTKTTTSTRGSGLGLSIVQAIVEDHGGQVDLESEVGEGATFIVYLPASREAIGERTAALVPVGGGGRVLVVDDDPLQREVLSVALSSLGYATDVAASGEQALFHLDGHGVDLVVLDMVMPGGIDGAETYRRARELNPKLRAVLLSGFAESERVLEAQRMGAGGYLRKPVNLGDLARAVREELSSK